MSVPYYPQSRYTVNLGLSLFGMDEVLAENFVILDTTIGSGGGGGGSSTIKVNGSVVTNPNFNNTIPAAPLGFTNVLWQKDGSGNVSAYVPTSGGSGTVTGGPFTPGNIVTGNGGQAVQDSGVALSSLSGGPFVQLHPTADQFITGNFKLGVNVAPADMFGFLGVQVLFDSSVGFWPGLSAQYQNRNGVNVDRDVDPGYFLAYNQSAATDTQYRGVYLDVENQSTGRVTSMMGAYSFGANLDPAGTVGDYEGFWSTFFNSGGTVDTYVGFFNEGMLSGVASKFFGFYSQDVAGMSPLAYYSWFDSRGVRRIKEDNTFNAVGQAIEALYNPQFTKYTPGAADFERVILGQWSSNVAQIGTEKGGTGTLRNLQLIGAGLVISPLVISYNGISTVSNGIPSEYATVDLTAQGASIGSTTLYTVPASGAGVYRVLYYMKITRAGSTSGSVTLTLGWTDRDDSTALSTIVPTPANATDNTSVVSGTLIVDAKLSTNLIYATTYASVGGTSMQYKLRLKVEAL